MVAGWALAVPTMSVATQQRNLQKYCRLRTQKSGVQSLLQGHADMLGAAGGREGEYIAHVHPAGDPRP
jgi:hypothetical protein